MLNKVQLIGRLGRDPESRSTQSGDKVVNFPLATDEKWTDKSTGEKRERVEWHRIVIFNTGLAEIAERYLRKGSLCFIEGQSQTRKWTDQSGQDRYTTEVVLQKFRGEIRLLGGRQEDRSAPDDGDKGEGQTTEAAGADLDDEIPF